MAATTQPRVGDLAQAMWVIGTRLDGLGAEDLAVFGLEAFQSPDFVSYPVTVVVSVIDRRDADLVADHLGLGSDSYTASLYVRSGTVLGIQVEVWTHRSCAPSTWSEIGAQPYELPYEQFSDTTAAVA